jgi:LmbE family N-acetylglucosaminyl deacetylase
MSEFEVPAHAAVIVAHPDDPDFMAAGTLARWTALGGRVTLVIVSDGSKGTADRTLLPHELIATRKAEQRAAAAVLGVQEVLFLNQPDGQLVPDLALRRLLTGVVREIRPDTIVTHDPGRLYYDTYVNHPDHRAVGQATLDAVYPTARDHLNYPAHLADGMEPHKVKTLLLSAAVKPDYFVDITDTFELKLAALREHKSQIGDPDKLAERLREIHETLGGDKGMDLAEAFKRITLS